MENLVKKDLLDFMNLKDKNEIDKLYNRAYNIKLHTIGKNVYYRGLIEISNICYKDCFYCGIRKSNKIHRFDTSLEEIVSRAEWAYKNNYGSITLQAGESTNEKFIEFIEKAILKIKEMSNGELGITLSLGEQSKETYERWRKAGAHRYLLRIETSNKELYEKIHPIDKNHSFETRVKKIELLKQCNYQVGTGVMIGLPFQTNEDLVNDILFFKQMDIDMIGMGPYIVSENTPLGKYVLENNKNTEEDKYIRYEKSLKMIALTRIYLKDVNIAATTALQALNATGREEGIMAGANILMPIITTEENRKDYQLYDGKPCISDTSDECKRCLSNRVSSVGEKIGYGEWGDSPHFKNRLLKNN